MVADTTVLSQQVQAPVQPISVVVLGVGTVGSALLSALDTPRFQDRFQVVAAASSRGWLPGQEVRAECAYGDAVVDFTQGVLRERVADSGRSAVSPEQVPELFADVKAGDGRRQGVGRGGPPQRVIVDATASAAVAAQHPTWLASGCHVVTANKWGLGGEPALWDALSPYLAGTRAAGGQRVRYGASATVGAGLPFLRAVSRLAEAEEVLQLRGCLSGTLAWLLDDQHSKVAFSETVQEAVRLGFCEPDPLVDVGGADVVRKAVILARAAGCVANWEKWDVEPVIPAATVADIPASDALMADRFAHAHQVGASLAYVANIDVTGSEAMAEIGVQEIDAADPLAGHGTGNVLEIRTSRYADHPVVMAGPGAGPEVTAGAILDDLLAVTAP